ncbi:prephenate dehydrogenase [uncultured Neglectibacter sp.]|uniref:prephenate dehydrogenase n=1 Tax=uncultured Neglectibacter sp. TaxID=1924108 RepID=UPI0034DFADBE
MRKKIVVVGLGLIGGSIAKALKLNTDHIVLGVDTQEDTLLDACSCGAIDGKTSPEDLRTADVVYLCIYPESALEFAKENGPMLKEGCILTDACGIKGEICQGMERLRGTGKYVFVAGHPMAGKELSGFAASDAGIFAGASYLIAPCGAPEWAVDEVASLAKSMGFGRVVMTTPEQHDREIAFTSQLPHVLACSYVMSPRCKEHQGFSAGSYRDVSRVANINDVLWSRLFLDNREELLSELDELIKNLSSFRCAIDSEDEERLRQLLRHAAEIKREVG